MSNSLKTATLLCCIVLVVLSACSGRNSSRDSSPSVDTEEQDTSAESVPTAAPTLAEAPSDTEETVTSEEPEVSESDSSDSAERSDSDDASTTDTDTSATEATDSSSTDASEPEPAATAVPTEEEVAEEPAEEVAEEVAEDAENENEEDVQYTGRTPEEMWSALACAACHMLDQDQSDENRGPVGPHQGNLAERVAIQAPGQDPEEYVYISIVDPNDYVVEGYFEDIMPQNFGEMMTEEEIRAMVTWLLNRE